MKAKIKSFFKGVLIVFLAIVVIFMVFLFLDEKKSGQKFWERYQKREQKLRQIKAEIDQNEKMLDVMKHSRLWRAYRIFKKL